MSNLQIISDRAAIGLSLLCTVHCLAMPLLLVLLPSITALSLHDENFHLWMLLTILPVSIYALTMGCRVHSRYGVLFAGGVGLFLLVLASIGGHDTFGETLEKTLTVLGAATIAFGHFWNYRLCQAQRFCSCTEAQ